MVLVGFGPSQKRGRLRDASLSLSLCPLLQLAGAKFTTPLGVRLQADGSLQLLSGKLSK